MRLLDGRTVHARWLRRSSLNRRCNCALPTASLAVPPAAWRAPCCISSVARRAGCAAGTALPAHPDRRLQYRRPAARHARAPRLQLRGIVADRSAQIYVPYLAMSGLAVEPAAGRVASTGRSSGPRGGVTQPGRRAALPGGQGGRSAVAELPVIDVADATATGGEEAMAPYRLAARPGLPVLELAALPLPCRPVTRFLPPGARRLVSSRWPATSMCCWSPPAAGQPGGCCARWSSSCRSASSRCWPRTGRSTAC